MLLVKYMVFLYLELLRVTKKREKMEKLDQNWSTFERKLIGGEVNIEGR